MIIILGALVVHGQAGGAGHSAFLRRHRQRLTLACELVLDEDEDDEPPDIPLRKNGSATASAFASGSG